MEQIGAGHPHTGQCGRIVATGRPQAMANPNRSTGGRLVMSPARIRSRALAVIAATALLSLALGVGVASAGQQASLAENTFTKWIAGYPNMAGVVGGDVGTGTYAGVILSRTGTGTAADPILITADYHFYGSHHSFTAHVDIVEIGASATVNGVVADGWLKGNLAEGEFSVIQCTHGTITGTCFQGTLDILRGTKLED
jgi:hypothetical protein